MTDPYSPNDRGWLICAPSFSEARRMGKEILVRRRLKYSGLAKRAISMLMKKTYGKTPVDNVPEYVTKTAGKNTRVNEFA